MAKKKKAKGKAKSAYSTPAGSRVKTRKASPKRKAGKSYITKAGR